jgi:hypothetical protein
MIIEIGTNAIEEEHKEDFGWRKSGRKFTL